MKISLLLVSHFEQLNLVSIHKQKHFCGSCGILLGNHMGTGVLQKLPVGLRAVGGRRPYRTSREGPSYQTETITEKAFQICVCRVLSSELPQVSTQEIDVDLGLGTICMDVLEGEII